MPNSTINYGSKGGASGSSGQRHRPAMSRERQQPLVEGGLRPSDSLQFHVDGPPPTLHGDAGGGGASGRRRRPRMYLFHSSSLPVDDDAPGRVGEKSTARRPAAAPNALLQQQQQHQQQQKGSNAHPPLPSHYSLGRLSSSQRIGGAATTPSTASLPSITPSRGSGDVAASPLITAPTRSRNFSPSSLYEQYGNAPELLLALRLKADAAGSGEYHNKQPARSSPPPPPQQIASGGVSAASWGASASALSGCSSSVYPSLRARDGPEDGTGTSNALAPFAGPQQQQQHQQHHHQYLSPPTAGSHISGTDHTQSVRSNNSNHRIPFSLESPHRSNLPSQESSMCAPHHQQQQPPPPPHLRVEAAAPSPELSLSISATETTAPGAAGMGRAAATPRSGSSACDDDDDDERGDIVGDDAEADGEAYYISPCMPKGRYVVLNLLSSWGDEYEVGLCGVEFFDERGHRILPQPPHPSPPPAVSSSLSSAAAAAGVVAGGGGGGGKGGAGPGQAFSIERGVASLSCAPGCDATSVHIVAEYKASGEEVLALGDAARVEALRTDPRRQLANLVNGRHRTHDEASMFVMPYTEGHHHLICFIFPQPVTLSMIRLHNYCGQGRVHTSKGVSAVEVTMDDVCIYRGEVAQHSGIWGDDPSEEGLTNCENILFTAEPHILARIMERGGTQNSTSNRSTASSVAGHGEEAEDTCSGGAVSSASSRPATRTTTRTTRYIIRKKWDTDGGDMAATARFGPGGGCSFDETPVGPPRPASMGGGATAAAAAYAMGGDPVRLTGGGGGGGGGGVAMMGSAAAAQPLAPPPAAGDDAPRRRQSERLYSAGLVRGTPVTALSSRHGRSAWGEEGEGEGDAAAGEEGRQPQPQLQRAAQYPSHCPANITSLCIMVLTTWGDIAAVGLGGLRLRDSRGNLVAQPVARACVQYPDGSFSSVVEQSALAAQAPLLFDESAATACTLPFVPAMQIVLEFAAPVPSLGFLEVANYSVGDKTFSGAKEVRLFLSDAPAAAAPAAAGRGGVGGKQPPPMCAEALQHLWSVGSSATSRRALQRACVFEVTPPEGVTLRKAPAQLSRQRYQTYDLSLQAPAPLSPSITSAVDARYVISAGPGTGGAAGGLGASTLNRGGGGGGPGGGGMMAYVGGGTASFANSLNASMNIRANMAMRRARMTLRDRPEWLSEYQPYITPLLPVGYVYKVRLDICARNVGGGDRADFFLSQGAVLEAYLTDWVSDPLLSCTFLNENGKQVVPVRPGDEERLERQRRQELERQRRQRRQERNWGGGGGGGIDRHRPRGGVSSGFRLDIGQGSSSSDDDDDDEAAMPAWVPMVVESIVTTTETTTETATTTTTSSPNAARPSSSSSSPPPATQLGATLELVYVADTPFCVSVVTLHPPLVLSGSAAWVKKVQVRVDDTLIYDSGTAALDVARGGSGSSRASSRPTTTTTTTVGGGGQRRPTACEALMTGMDLIPCVTTLRPHAVFTLDGAVLDSLGIEQHI